jgi:hypothetical protein
MVGDEHAKVTVGDPSLVPGERGGPCKDEDCGHEDCKAARKFIADAHPCAICKKPFVWGDWLGAYYPDGTSSNVADMDLNPTVLVHDKCRKDTNCAVCNMPLVFDRKPFRLHGNDWVHDGCSANSAE